MNNEPINIQSIYSDIVNDTKTDAQTTQLLSEIDRIQKSLYTKTQSSFEEVLKKNVRLKIAERFLVVWEKMDSINDYAKIQNSLEELKTTLKKLRILKLTLSFDPTESDIGIFFQWTKKNLGEGIILHVESNPTILGGAIIEFCGIYKDLSVKKKLETVFKDKREEVLRIMFYS